MGNVFVSNEPTLKDKLRDQLCRIVLEYEKLELICGYIAIFEIFHTSSDNNDDDDGVNIQQHSYDTATNIQQNSSYDYHHQHQQYHNHHHHSASTRGNLKVKEKKEIQKIIDLDYQQICEWKINEIMKNNPNMTEQELIDNHGLILYSSSSKNNINLFSKSNPLISMFKDDEKENLLQNQNETNMLNIHDAPSSTNNIHDIKDILENNDIKSSVQSLGDTTDQLLQILDRAKILQLHAHKARSAQNNKIIHIRGNKQTIFSYYLILNRYIIISYAQSKSDYLSFLEWIKIQSKLEKLEITLKDIQALLK